ncbi:uncharacterized protein BX664DRAFT_295627 [Halteromyces radiatus]|uniref:uncharacterized protein n=1 Tax=Halteromyces radiatus TaxID=101107 RepID=UPI002220B5C5|nr:uncharacterized protein BX664DRAFT_295627 [Halteromyces radiatus]KAI8093723.1 hypothetical protein BX664DRAFT_295627 [Halteromyces radiatus]
MQEREYSTKTWNQHVLNPKQLNQHTVDWIFLVDLLNFSFWSDLDHADKATPHPDRYAITYQGVAYTGYWSLCAAINRALDHGIPVTTFKYLAEANESELALIFKSDTKEEIPMLKERIELMKHAGKVMCQYFDGSFIHCIEKANRSAQALIDLLLEYFPSFRDIHEFKGRKVYILKRAQILIADIWACFDGSMYGEFYDIDTITMFADYRVPQALYHLGLLEYNTELKTKLIKREKVLSGSQEEIEIRGNSIWAVELVRQKIQEQYHNKTINAILIDFYIWDLAKEIQNQLTVPTHHTRSCFY